MIYLIEADQKEHWDGIVRSFKNYDVFYLNRYAEAFRQLGHGEPLLFYYENNGTKAINVFMKRDIGRLPQFKDRLPENTWIDLSTPYGYGGFWVDGTDYEGVNKAYGDYCKEQGFVSEFVRFHLYSGFERHYSGKTETHTHNVVRSTELPLDEILKDFEHKVRKNLKRARSSGLQIEIDPTGARLDDFLGIYYETMRRTAAKESFFFPKPFFETLNTMAENYAYFHVLSDDQVISTELVLYGSENCYSYLGGTNSDFFHLRPNEFLKFEVIKWAKAKGLKRFILGGGYGDDDGIFQYKKSLAPNGICEFYIGKKILDTAKYQKLNELRKEEPDFDTESPFFPLYRA